ncbi:MAG: HDOD domain-containing protein [Phycisphaeraceae bacterium]|nr:HDOD domain-containing protein [Phycisphaeraceae bacterium]HRJ49361.1 HDOD domain-containing protein [Phycisphaerales bacterium]
MESTLLEEVLACPSLPSLPAVAVRVIELTADRNVSLKELADTIQNDQGLSSKVLRTVNSSYYGLRTRCSSINKALVMLGLGPVKALTLGFSLVASQEIDPRGSLDLVAYWRRGLYTAVASKSIAEAARMSFGDEAFLAGLLQDIGVMAMHQALGSKYDEVLRAAGGDHGKLVRLELESLDMQHPEVGAMLAERWRLPNELVMPVRFHERPTAAPVDCADIVRCVALGNIAHDVLTDADPGAALKRLYAKTDQWFKITPSVLDDTLRVVAQATKELSSLFKLQTGAACDIDAVLNTANERLSEIRPPLSTTSTSEDGLANLLAHDANVDPLTGAMARSAFDTSIRWAFGVCKTQGGPIGLVQVSIDCLDAAHARGGHELGDQVLVGVASLLHKHFIPLGGVVCRLNGGLFSIVLQGVTNTAILRSVSEFRADLERGWPRWKTQTGQTLEGMSASVGIACRDPQDPAGLGSPSELIIAAARAIQKCREESQAGVRTSMAA